MIIAYQVLQSGSALLPSRPAQFRALVFSKTPGSATLDPGGHHGDEEARRRQRLPVDAIEEQSLFTDDFLTATTSWSSCPPRVTAPGAAAGGVRALHPRGRRLAGIHSAADTEYDWHWYGQLVGAYFRNHPAGTPTATVVVEDTNDPSTAGPPGPLDARGRVVQLPGAPQPGRQRQRTTTARAHRGIHVLLTMDESTYAEDDGTDGVDDDHPISWCQRYDGGRSWYTGMGHTQATFSERAIPHAPPRRPRGRGGRGRGRGLRDRRAGERRALGHDRGLIYLNIKTKIF